MPREIKVHRAGCAVWLDIDGYETPVDWIDAAAVQIGAADGPDQVVVTLYADHVIVDAQDIAADVRLVEVPDGEAEEGSAQEAVEQLLRLPVDKEVSDPRP